MLRSKPSIIFALTHFRPHVGGVEKYVENQAKRLVALGYSVDVVCLNTAGGEDVEVLDGYTIHRVPTRIMLADIVGIPKLTLWFSVMKELMNKDSSVVVTHTRFFFTSFLAYMQARLLKVPVLHTEHGSGPVPHVNAAVRLGALAVDYIFGCTVIKGANMVTVVSSAGKRYVAGFWKRSDAVVTYNGIDTSFWVPCENVTINHEITTIAMVGRVVEAKGYTELLEACAKVQSEWVLEVIGDGADMKKYKEYAVTLGIADRITWHGYGSADEIKELLRRADIFAHPSHAEGLPTTVLEAASVGLPIVATSVGGTAEILSEANELSCLVEPHNTPALCEALEKVIHNLRKLSSQVVYQQMVEAHQRVAKKFDWNSLSEQYAILISKLRN